MVLKEVKMYLFGDNFWTAGGRGLKFCRMVRTWCKQLLAKFGVTTIKSLWVIPLFVVPKFDSILRMRSVSGPWGPPEQILAVKFEFQRLALLLAQNLPMASKNAMVLKEINFEYLRQIVYDFDEFDLKIPGCEAMDTNEFNLLNNLIAYDFCEQNSRFLPVNRGQT